MKKLLAVSLFSIFGMTSMAQNAKTDSVPTSKPVPAAALTKEEKAMLKAKQDADFNAALKEAELTDEQIAAVKEAVADANKKSKDLTNAGLSESDFTTAKKLISDQKNAKLKEIMGEDKYRKYNAARKRQKEETKVQ